MSIARAITAGINTFIVDWEFDGKTQRQAGRDTEINRDTFADLCRISKIDGAAVVCRTNKFSQSTRDEVEMAIGGGASLLLLPMVSNALEVEMFLAYVGGRVGAGILIETGDAVQNIQEISQFDIQAVYIGLNDLAISLGRDNIFAVVADGTLDKIAEVLLDRRIPFGWGGLTLVDAGSPIPCRLLMAEMARVRSRFSFLRRSFRRHMVGRDVSFEVRRIQEMWRHLHLRSTEEIRTDQQELYEACRKFPTFTVG